MSRRFAGTVRHLVGSGGVPFSGEQISGMAPALAAAGLFPESPNRLLGGTLLTTSPGTFRAFSSLADLSRRPGQARRPFVPTQGNLAANLADPLSRQFQFAMGQQFRGAEAGRTRAGLALYTNQYAGLAGLGEGEFGMTRGFQRSLQSRTIQNIQLSQIESNVSNMLTDIGGGTVY